MRAMSDGHIIVGGSLSLTMTLKLQLLVFPAASMAVHKTVLVPFGKSEPDGGVQLALAPGQLSVTIGSE